MPHETVEIDGSFDFSGGVDSQAVTTLRSSLVPHGLRRDQLAWLSNATVRGGAIQNRTGWFKLLDLLTSGVYAGGIMYEPRGDLHPYGIYVIDGQIYKILYEAPFAVTNLSSRFGVALPKTTIQAYLVVGEGLLVVQAGDGVTNPLFYWNAFQSANNTGIVPETLRQSNGLNANPALSELPPATAMVYYAGHIWYAQNRIFTAGDTVDNHSSGTAPFAFDDSILKVTENPLAVGGDGFRLPSQAGNIRAMSYTATVDTTLGQGALYVGTRKQIYAFTPPANRTAWIAMAGNTTPILVASQINNGWVSERGIVHVNGDLFYQSLDPAIRSLIVATRYYSEWGNVPISQNVIRALQFNDRSILRFASGVTFDNRLLEGVLPIQTPSGAACQGMLPLNFDTVSTLGERFPPCWEGYWTGGINILQSFTGDFGGLERMFSVIVSPIDGKLHVWEHSNSLRTDFTDPSQAPNTEKRIEWQVEFPAFTWGREYELKELVGGELWVDRVAGTVDVNVEYRPDADQCWHPWFHTAFCVARNCAEDITNPICYPAGPTYRTGSKWPIGFPKPPAVCEKSNGRPTNIGFQFQARVTVQGAMRIRGILLFVAPKEAGIYKFLKCTEFRGTSLDLPGNPS